jgi:hypothetical protein
MQADRPYLIVGNTATGAQLAGITSPSGVYLNAVYGGAADDREFVVTGDRVPSGGAVWYLLRITPGSRTPAQMPAGCRAHRAARSTSKPRARPIPAGIGRARGRRVRMKVSSCPGSRAGCLPGIR